MNADTKPSLLVSVIIPTYNRADTIERAVESVLAQTWPEIETIVVDDGSRDQTRDVLAKFGNSIRVITQTNQGPSAARNNGIKMARGEIISFLDSDDSWLPEKTERQVRLMHRSGANGIGCCVSNIHMHYNDQAPTTSFALADLRPEFAEGIWHNPIEILLTRFLLFNQAVAVRRDVLEKAGYFRQNLRILEDYDFALRLAMTTQWGYTAEPLVVWNGGSANSLTANSSDLAICQQSCEILNALNSSANWGGKLPADLLRKRIRYLKIRSLALQSAKSSKIFNTWRGKGMLRLIKTYKSFHDRLPSFPKMVTEKA